MSQKLHCFGCDNERRCGFCEKVPYSRYQHPNAAKICLDCGVVYRNNVITKARSGESNFWLNVPAGCLLIREKSTEEV